MITPSVKLPLKKNINKSSWNEVRKFPALSLMKYSYNEWVITLQGTVCVEATTQSYNLITMNNWLDVTEAFYW